MTNENEWQPSLGAWPERGGTRFRVWAPTARSVELVLEDEPARGQRHLDRLGDGYFDGWFPDVRAGALYRYRPDGRGLYPDPASRFQPAGVHGPSQVVDPRTFDWSDEAWKGPDPNGLVFYELHVGTFSAEGTFSGVTERLSDLAALGVTAIELMPVADFAGRRNWGYDGVDLFAPARCYGTPDDLRRLVDTAHTHGVAVVLDVVYNHLGADGAYLSAFSPYYFTDRHSGPWGAVVNLDGAHSDMVRSFFIENAKLWLHEYHVDGLRLDATHTLSDGGSCPFLAELASRVRPAGDRRILLVAEDRRNLATIVEPREAGGWGLDAVWADDFHHQLRRLLAGDSEGYYADYSGTIRDLATTIRQGWFFTGQHSTYLGVARGTNPGNIPLGRFTVCLQNHDQVGNRALGDRLHHSIELPAYRAASMLLLIVPETPLLFMGQEWAAASPFLYFTDHHADLGRLVTEGRRREFRHFSAFSDPDARSPVPDPQAESTFAASRLDWSERDCEPHTSTLRLYRALLALRRLRPALWETPTSFEAAALDEHTIAILRECGSDAVLAVIRLRGSGTVHLERGIAAKAGLDREARARLPGRRWERLLSTEDPEFAPDPAEVETDLSSEAPVFRFRRPSGVVLGRSEEGHTVDSTARRR